MTERTPDRRPDVVLFDVFETLLQLDALGARFAEVGRPAGEWELFFARLLRDGMALTLAGGVRPFAEVARGALRTTSGHTLDDEALDHVLDGFRHLPAQPDAEPAFAALREAGVPAWGFTHGGAATAAASLEEAGLRRHLRGVFSAEAVPAFKPLPRVYHWACEQVGSTPARTALVAVHSWDVHGAVRAGLVGGLATRLDGAVNAVFARPHVVAERLDAVVEGILAFPAG